MSQLVLDWVKQNNVMNTLFDNDSPNAACDAYGNIYVTYGTSGIASGQQNTGSNDVVVFKMDVSGTVQWVRQNSTMNTIIGDYNPTIACDTVGNIYIAYYTINGTASGQQNAGATYDIVVFKMDSSGTVQWVRQNAMMNTRTADSDPKITCDALGNLYVAYYTSGTASGEQKPGNFDIVVFKMDSSGTVLWVRQNAMMNTSSADYSPTIACDASGNLYVTYYTVGGTASGGQNTGTYDIVVFKMDSFGTVQWVRQDSTMNTSTSDYYPSIACDAVGNLYVAYYTINGTASGGQNTGVSQDIVVFKMDSSGTVQWVRQNSTMNTSTTDYNPKIACDALGNLYVAYYTTGTASGQQTTGSNDIVVFKMDSFGTVQWVRQDQILNTYTNEIKPFIVFNNNNIYVIYQTAGSVNGQLHTTPSRDIVVTKMTQSGTFTQAIQEFVMNTDLSDNNPSFAYDSYGNIYVTYYTAGAVSGGKTTGGSDIVVFKMNSSGVVQWIRQNAMMSTSGTDYNPTIACDTSGNLYVAYFTTGAASGAQNTGSNDIVVFKMDSSGTVQWVRQDAIMNTSMADGYPTIVCDASGNLYVSYYTNGTSSGGQNTGASYDIVVLKLDNLGTIQWVRQNAMMNTNKADTNPTITCDASGNLYIVYPTNLGTASGGTNTGFNDIIVFKMDSSGTVQWVRQNAMMNTSSSEYYPTITSDALGNLYIAYYTSGTASGGQNTGASNDIVVFKMDSAGTVQWVRQNALMNTDKADTYPKIACDTSGNLYVTYYTTGTASGQQNAGGSDIVVFKMDSFGTVQWVRQNASLNTNGSELNPVIGVGPSGDLIITYTTDRAVGNVNYGGISNDIVVAKLRELPLFPPQIIQGISLGDYLSAAFSQITPDNKQTLKDYILQNRTSFASPIADVSGSVIAQLVDSQASGYNVGTVGSVVTILPQTDGQTTTTALNITEHIPSLISGAKGLYFFGTKGYIHTIQIDNIVYSLTITDDGLRMNDIYYTMDTEIPFGNYRFTIKYVGSVGGVLTQVYPLPLVDPGTNTSYPADNNIYTAGTRTEDGRAAIVSPFSAYYSSVYSAQIGVQDKTSKQYFTGIDAVFERTIDEVDAVKFLNSFSIVDTNVDLGNNINGPVADENIMPKFTVDLVDISGFKEVLTGVMMTATQTTGKNKPNITSYFEEEMRVELNRQLSTNDLQDILEGSNVTNVHVTLQYGNGADSMASTIATDTTAAAAKRRQFLSQIPLSSINAYYALAQKSAHYLPLKGGDSITMVFDITVQAPTALGGITANQYDTTDNKYMDTVGTSIGYSPEQRRVAFVIHLTNKNTTFRRHFAAVSAMGAPVITNIADAKKYVKEKTEYLTMYNGTYVSDLLAQTVSSPFTTEEWIAQAKYELARDEQLAYAGSGSYVSTISSITEAV